MEQNTRHRRDWTGLLLEFLVVVAGIAITFAGEGFINRYNEQKEVKSSLGLVRDELNDDIDYVRQCDSMFVAEREAIDFLWHHKKNFAACNDDSLTLDSLNRFCNRPFHVAIYSESHEALELLKNTGVFSKIKDKELALDIVHAYGYLTDYMASGKFYSDKKIKLTEELTELPYYRALFADPSITVAQFWQRIADEEHGDYYLRETRNQLYSRANAQRVIDDVQAVVDKIETYCK